VQYKKVAEWRKNGWDEVLGFGWECGAQERAKLARVKKKKRKHSDKIEK